MKTQGHQQDVLFLSGTRTGFGSFGGTLKDLSAIDLGVVAAKAALERAKVEPGHGRSCRLRQRAADQRRRHLPGPPRRSQVGPPHRDSRGHRQPALRLRFRVHHPGRAADPARRVEHRAGRRRRVDEPGAARGARGALGAPARPGAAVRGLALGIAQGSAVRLLHGGDRGEPRRQVQDCPRRRWTPTRSRASIAPRRRGTSCAFKDEVVPVTIRNRKTRQDEPWTADEHMRPDTTAEGLAKLPPYFKKDGVVTAGMPPASATAPPRW